MDLAEKIQLYIADDQDHCLESLRLALEDAPDIHIAGVAQSGEQLLALVANNLPQVVITDINMSATDGITATRLLREQYPSIKILGFTQYTDERLLIEMMHAGADGYLYKGTDSYTIATAVRMVVNDGNFFCTRTLKKLAQVLQQGIFCLSPKPIPPGFFVGKEKDVLLLLCEGLGGKQIAARLGLTENTVNKYRANLREKTGRPNDAMLVLFAVQHSLFNPDS